ncbi:MAG: hypothetical protein ACL93V_16850 [Candidatus Electrothrix sp. YB6]
MEKLLTACFLSLPLLMACGAMHPLEKGGDTKRALNTVELQYPNVTFTFPSTRKTYRSGESFPPPKTIDCSNLTLKSDSFKDAIEAGALIVRIKTPRQVKQIVKDKKGKEIVERVKIKPVYGGVLALCKVSPNATGPDSRSYRIRDLDDRLIKGQNGFISVIGANLSQGNQLPSLQDLGKVLNIDTGLSSKSINIGRTNYSWMLWLTDRTSTFTDYEGEMIMRKRKEKAAKARAAAKDRADQARAEAKAREEARKAKSASK